jgi:hypothetical protein
MEAIDVHDDHVEGLRRYKRDAVCPHCGQPIECYVTVGIVETQVPQESTATRGKPWAERLSPEQRQILEALRQQGLVQAFQAAMEEIPSQNRPKDAERYLFTWLQKAAPRVVPPFAIAYFKAEFHRESLSFYAADAIIAVVANGCIKGFIPMPLLVGRAVKGLTGSHNIRARLPATPEALDQWVRTRFGYVMGHGPAFEMLQQRSFGAFAQPGLWGGSHAR